MTGQKKETKEEQICGIVMPISAIDGCNETHWHDVLEIINDAICEVGFTPNLVSNADDVGVIHKRIIQNLYDNPIIVCDVSGRNPNVMFELGLRLAFDKPTIIIKDDKTSYSFDTSAIEHIEYPRDLRFNKIQEFKSLLSDKIKNTYAKYLADPANFSTFLKHFGAFKIAKIEETEVSQQEYIMEEIKGLRNLIINNRRNPFTRKSFEDINDGSIDICCGATDKDRIEIRINELLKTNTDIVSYRIDERGSDHRHLEILLKPGADSYSLKNEIRNLVREKQIPVKNKKGVEHFAAKKSK